MFSSVYGIWWPSHSEWTLFVQQAISQFIIRQRDQYSFQGNCLLSVYWWNTSYSIHPNISLDHFIIRSKSLSRDDWGVFTSSLIIFIRLRCLVFSRRLGKSQVVICWCGLMSWLTIIGYGQSWWQLPPSNTYQLISFQVGRHNITLPTLEARLFDNSFPPLLIQHPTWMYSLCLCLSQAWSDL